MYRHTFHYIQLKQFISFTDKTSEKSLRKLPKLKAKLARAGIALSICVDYVDFLRTHTNTK